MRDILGCKKIYPQAKACAYHFTGYHPRTSGWLFYLSKAKALPYKNPNAKLLMTLSNLAHGFYRSSIRYKNMERTQFRNRVV
ncbi:MAG: hypothetical protein ABIL74_00670 [candidate division WOR-3 bacterium]